MMLTWWRSATSLILFLVIPGPLLFGNDDPLQFLLSNRTGVSREAEIVHIPLLFEERQRLETPGFFLLQSCDGWTGMAQVDDTDWDGEPDEIAFLLDFAPGQERKITLGPRISYSKQQGPPNHNPLADQGFLALPTEHSTVYAVSPQGAIAGWPAENPTQVRDLVHMGIRIPSNRGETDLWFAPFSTRPSFRKKRGQALPFSFKVLDETTGPVRSLVRLEANPLPSKKDGFRFHILYIVYPLKPWLECRVRIQDHFHESLRFSVGLPQEIGERYFTAGRDHLAVLDSDGRGLMIPPLWNRGILQPSPKRRYRQVLLEMDSAGRVVFRVMACSGEEDLDSQWKQWHPKIREEAWSFRNPIGATRLSQIGKNYRTSSVSTVSLDAGDAVISSTFPSLSTKTLVLRSSGESL